MAPIKHRVTKQNWLQAGYIHFAKVGPYRLSVNRLSKELGATRASFYNYFGDINIFIDKLLEIHWTTTLDFNKKAKVTIHQLFPDFYDFLSQYTIPLQFSFQLFRHRNFPAYNLMFMKTYEASAKAILLKLFAQECSLKLSSNELFKLWLTVGEAWYSRLNPEDLSSTTLQKNAKDILNTVKHFSASHFILPEENIRL